VGAVPGTFPELVGLVEQAELAVVEMVQWTATQLLALSIPAVVVVVVAMGIQVVLVVRVL
jgi:hypothetical protein